MSSQLKATPHTHTILIVDDDPINSDLLCKYLLMYNFEATVAENGPMAFKHLDLVKPDLILLDIKMSDMDGFEICRRIKSNDETREIPVVFMTALSNLETKVEGFKAGANDYITKPFQFDEVLARLNLHLKLADLATDLQRKNARLQSITYNLLETSNDLGQYVVTSELSLDALLMKIVTLIQSKFNYDRVKLWLTNETDETLSLDAAASEALYVHEELSLVSGESVLREAFQQGYLKRFVNVEQDCSTIILPLRVGQSVIGVLEIESQQLLGINQQDEATLQVLANQMAMIIRNAQLQAVQERRSEYLSQLNADKDRFFSIISHDLRGPFQAVVGYAELLMMRLGNARLQEINLLAQKLHQSAKNTYHLLENLLQWSRMQRGRMPYEPQAVGLADLVENTTSLLGNHANNKEIDLQAEIPETVEIHVDLNMIDAVIRNLTSNALKFTESGGVVKIEALENGPFVEVAISDTGVGLSAEDVAKLFRMDTHHSTSGTADEEGTGLGLILCKELVENHGGKIWMESELGVGTTVTFTVPAVHKE